MGGGDFFTKELPRAEVELPRAEVRLHVRLRVRLRLCVSLSGALYFF